MDGSDLYRVAFGTSRQPDPWQLALANDAWPQVLIAPTGAGKTAAVTLGWAAHRLRDPDGTPRRLIWCLPMRTLVEQTAAVVREWFDRLAAKDDTDLLPRPKSVHVLMGGVDADRWLEEPERPVVLVGTQDMLLSRALMRGYGSSRALWPMEFALLHNDAQWVFDEVQLMGAGRATSAQLEAFRQMEAARAHNGGTAPGKPSRSLWVSATLKPQWLRTVNHPEPCGECVLEVHASVGERLSRLANAPKRLTPASVAPASPKQQNVGNYVRELANTIAAKHRPAAMTLAIVNRVDRAQKLYQTLCKLPSMRRPEAPTLALIHSRFRPADRQREMDKVTERNDDGGPGRIVVATQAIEAGVDISAAVLFTELAPWSSMVQRFGRANRYAECADGAEVYWIDLLQAGDNDGDQRASNRDLDQLAIPYATQELVDAREHLRDLIDAAPALLPPTSDVDPPLRVIRRKDLTDLFDTDPDLTGFDVDVSPYVRDAEDTDIRVFWRDLSNVGDTPPRPGRGELCAVSIAAARQWIEKVRRRQTTPLLYRRDPQWRRQDSRTGTPPGWEPFRDPPWPGLVLLAHPDAGGYSTTLGFTGDPNHVPEPADESVAPAADSQAASETDGLDEDMLSQLGTVVPLGDHLCHVGAEAETLCAALDVDAANRESVVRAARWHDLGKAHEVFQDTMHRGLDGGRDIGHDALLAKTAKRTRHKRAYFRHELASALAFLAQSDWSRDADLIAYLIAAHHGKVRMNLRALPKEAAPPGDRAGLRFARGVWEGDELRPVDLPGGERWEGASLSLSVMEMGWDEASHESWTERTRELLLKLGPFRLAWLETLVRVADWRASEKERKDPRYRYERGEQT